MEMIFVEITDFYIVKSPVYFWFQAKWIITKWALTSLPVTAYIKSS